MGKPTFSLEFFPPKTVQAEEIFFKELAKLARLNPEFMTVTYGSGGSTKETTPKIIDRIISETGIPVASHITYINTTKEDLHKYINSLWQKGIHHVVALRGDMPKDLNWPLDEDGEYFQYTSDFVEDIKSWFPKMEISVGAYPEKHPDAPSLESDIIALKKKCDAGAARAITQFFFNNDNYFDFTKKCTESDIKTSIIPGLLPIHDFDGMCKFAKRCQANVPPDLRGKFETLKDNPKKSRELAIELLVNQVRGLIDNGVNHVHFYTLNKADITCDVIRDVFKP